MYALIIYCEILGKSKKLILKGAEAALKRFGLSQSMRSSTENLSVPWLLSKDDIHLATEHLKHTRIPAHIDCNPRFPFSNPLQLKSH